MFCRSNCGLALQSQGNESNVDESSYCRPSALSFLFCFDSFVSVPLRIDPMSTDKGGNEASLPQRNPTAHLMQVLTSNWLAQCMYVAAKLKVSEQLEVWI